MTQSLLGDPLFHPWFLGQDGPGLSRPAACELLGPRMHLFRTPDEPLHAWRQDKELRALLRRVAGHLYDRMKTAHRSRHTSSKPAMGGLFLGAQGIGIILGEQIYPVALRFLDGYRFLSVEESRQTVRAVLIRTPRQEELAS